eukprot:9999208-Lingulodinium_polyedra.AAC.1
MDTGSGTIDFEPKVTLCVLCIITSAGLLAAASSLAAGRATAVPRPHSTARSSARSSAGIRLLPVMG